MKTPIHDFVKAYASSAPVRLHMPGHKGRGPLGCEKLDLTEIPGADSLFEADGIIAESEANASRLFGCPTFYSTEGSSHCIRAMLLLAMQLHAAEDAGERIAAAGARPGRAMPEAKRFRVLAARNVHRAFLTAAALLDLDVVWLPRAEGSYLSAAVTPEALDAALAETGAAAVYLTCPDYLGFLPELRPLARVCHAREALLLVDNAHGAYLRFLSPSRHPMDLGADLCCDSAHKTLPVLTGGAYLHVSQAIMRKLGGGTGAVRDALALFGSTSPSYLILQSLDLANPYLEALPEKLAEFLPKLEALKKRLRAAGWTLTGNEPLKLTLAAGAAAGSGENGSFGSAALRSGRQHRDENAAATGIACPQADTFTGLDLAAALERRGIFCEFADPELLVLMLSPQNSDEELARLEAALTAPELFDAAAGRKAPAEAGAGSELPRADEASACAAPETVCSVRAAMLAPAVTVAAGESLGRVLARPGVSCPPAVPILMPGERIDAAAVAAFARYGIQSVAVLPE